MPDDLFAHDKVTERCLSRWRIHQYLTGTLDAEAVSGVEREVQTCARCKRALDVARAAQEAAAREVLPASLVNAVASAVKPAGATTAAAPERRRPRRFAGLVSAAAVAAAALLVFVVRPQGLWPPDAQDDASAVRRKGSGFPIAFSLQRDERLLARAEAASALPPVRAGDRLLVHVPGTAHVIVEGWEGGAWVTYFDGAPAPDGVLPIGIDVTSQGDTRLRVWTCARRPAMPRDRESCATTVFDFTP